MEGLAWLILAVAVAVALWHVGPEILDAVAGRLDPLDDANNAAHGDRVESIHDAAVRVIDPPTEWVPQ